jgi:hypothetical protein
MTRGGWRSGQEQRHGRHRQGATGAAWTPAVRPTEATPAHARRDGSGTARRPSDTVSAWPTSEVLTRRPGWPVEELVAELVPTARTGAQPWSGEPAWPPAEHAWPDISAQQRLLVDLVLPRQAADAPDEPEAAVAWPRHESDAIPAGQPRRTDTPAWPDHDRHDDDLPSFLKPRHRAPQQASVRAEPRHRRATPARRKTISADMVLDTVPMGRINSDNPSAVVYAVPEVPATGLRKFDLGNVPASVTPPRSWRRAAWFTIGTSAAVVLGLAVAAVELMGRPVSDSGIIDALPAYPTGPLTLEKLPDHDITAPTTGRPAPSSSRPKPSSQAEPTTSQRRDEPPKDTVMGGDTGTTSEGPGQTVPTSTVPTTQDEPPRRTVGPAPVTPTDPQAMGDRTEQYFALVTSDPAAAHAMTTGDMAREGEEGIEARYDGVERVEVQDIVIDRNQAVTTSTVTVVHTDGTETVERRQLTFTWGGDPKITDDSITQ